MLLCALLDGETDETLYGLHLLDVELSDLLVVQLIDQLNNADRVLPVKLNWAVVSANILIVTENRCDQEVAHLLDSRQVVDVSHELYGILHFIGVDRLVLVEHCATDTLIVWIGDFLRLTEVHAKRVHILLLLLIKHVF